MSQSAVREVLPDPSRGLNQSSVFIKLWPTVEVKSVADAMEYLRNKAPVPVHLSPLRRDERLTILVSASEVPRIEFGRSVPSGNWDAGFNDIVEVLKANGVQAGR